MKRKTVNFPDQMQKQSADLLGLRTIIILKLKVKLHS